MLRRFPCVGSLAFWRAPGVFNARSVFFSEARLADAHDREKHAYRPKGANQKSPTKCTFSHRDERERGVHKLAVGLETSRMNQSRAAPQAVGSALLVALSIAGCELRDAEAEVMPAVAVHDLSPDDPRVNECVSKYPRARYGLGEGMQAKFVESTCRERFGDSPVCDSATWVSMEAARCVARAGSLSQAHEWRAQLRVSHTFPPRMYWRIRLSEGQESDDQRNVDALSGGLLWRY